MIVRRNRCGPQVPALYEETIPENLPLHSEVVRVQATDCDNEFDFGTLTYTAIGDDYAPVSFCYLLSCNG